jgi:SAM-dependent methyltransferase
MGYSYNSLIRMVDARHRFAGKDVLTLGNLFPFVRRGEESLLAARGIDLSLPKEKFSAHLFTQVLGARSYQSLDVSDYQGSEIIANLNHPLPQEHLGRYDVVIDAGTLEHLANLSTALANIFGLLKPGGIYYFGVPCNNWVDHGFFQFSPTFFRDLCIDNPGLVLDDLYLGTDDRYYDYASQSPAFLRVLLASRHKLNVLGIIRKESDLLQLNLTQSKYRSLHAGTPAAAPAKAKPAHRLLFRAVRDRLSSWLLHTEWIPLGVKERVTNRLYRAKLRRRQQRQQAAAQGR